jgi:hypothetical protein
MAFLVIASEAKQSTVAHPNWMALSLLLAMTCVCVTIARARVRRQDGPSI